MWGYYLTKEDEINYITDHNNQKIGGRILTNCIFIMEFNRNFMNLIITIQAIDDCRREL